MLILSISTINVDVSFRLDEEIQKGVEVHKVHQSLEALLSSDHTAAIKELAETIDKKIHTLS